MNTPPIGSRWSYEAHPGSGHPPELGTVVETGPWVTFKVDSPGGCLVDVKADSWYRRSTPLPPGE